MTDIDGQISREFNRLGLQTSDVRYNDDLDRWRVTVSPDGTDDRYLRDITEIGAGGPVDYQLNFSAVKADLPRLDGASIPSGTLTVDGTDSEAILITVD